MLSERMSAPISNVEKMRDDPRMSLQVSELANDVAYGGAVAKVGIINGAEAENLNQRLTAFRDVILAKLNK